MEQCNPSVKMLPIKVIILRALKKLLTIYKIVFYILIVLTESSAIGICLTIIVKPQQQFLFKLLVQIRMESKSGDIGIMLLTLIYLNYLIIKVDYVRVKSTLNYSDRTFRLEVMTGIKIL